MNNVVASDNDEVNVYVHQYQKPNSSQQAGDHSGVRISVVNDAFYAVTLSSLCCATLINGGYQIKG